MEIISLTSPWLFLGITGKAQGIDNDSFISISGYTVAPYGWSVQGQKSLGKGQNIRRASPGDSTSYGWSHSEDTFDIYANNGTRMKVKSGWPGSQQGEQGKKQGNYGDFDDERAGAYRYLGSAVMQKPGQGERAGWQRGDRGLFTYNPIERTLSLKLERTNTLYTIDNLPSTYTAHIFCRMCFANSSVRMSAVQ